MNVLALGARVVGEALATERAHAPRRALRRGEERHARRVAKKRALRGALPARRGGRRVQGGAALRRGARRAARRTGPGACVVGHAATRRAGTATCTGSRIRVATIALDADSTASLLPPTERPMPQKFSGKRTHRIVKASVTTFLRRPRRRSPKRSSRSTLDRAPSATGARCFTSWSSQPYPPRSLNEANHPVVGTLRMRASPHVRAAREGTGERLHVVRRGGARRPMCPRGVHGAVRALMTRRHHGKDGRRDNARIQEQTAARRPVAGSPRSVRHGGLPGPVRRPDPSHATRRMVVRGPGRGRAASSRPGAGRISSLCPRPPSRSTSIA